MKNKNDTFNKTINKRTIVLLTSIITIVLILGILIYAISFKQHTLAVSESQDKSYKITIKYSGPFTIGPEGIHIYYKKKGDFFEHKVIKTLLYNRGASLDESNYKIEWNDDTAKITLHGEKQKDEIFDVDFSKGVKVTKETE
ncbi:MAG: hypothetical protein Q8936_18400 [Bacillota bacterium]|nr:hypothetical protein [Bacillota bacterium]